MAIQFTKATKSQMKLRMALDGPPGSGKTYTALLIAELLGGTTALADSEHGSAKHYSSRFNFHHCDLPNHSLATYLEATKAAAAGGFSNYIADSFSHAWNGKGGALEQVDKVSGSKFSNGWKVVSPLLATVVDALLCYPGHVLATMRTKMAFEVVTENGRAVPKRVGLAPVMRDGVEYEFDVVLDLTHEGLISVSKSRCGLLAVGSIITRPEIPAMVETLKAWLSEGAPVSLEEDLRERIKFAQTDEDLSKLRDSLIALKASDAAGFERMKVFYVARKTEFSA